MPPSAQIVLFALEFTFVNSTLEELFWRVFLYRELGAVLHETTDVDLESDINTKTSLTFCGFTVARPDPRLEKARILVSCYYASYHFVVMVCFVPWYLAFLGAVALTILGRFFVFCRETESLGLLSGIGFHAGADAAVGHRRAAAGRAARPAARAAAHAAARSRRERPALHQAGGGEGE